MPEQNSSQTSIAKYLGIFIIGVMVPLAATIMPWAIERVFPPDVLTFSFNGPISAKKFVALEFIITNRGSKVEKNIEARIPVIMYNKSEIKHLKNGTIKVIEKSPEIIMESSVPSTKISRADKMLILKINSLKPTEKAKIKLLIYNGDALIFDNELEKTRVTSENVLGQYDGISEIEQYVYKAGTWLFIFLFLLLIIYSIYYEYFMSREKKEKYLLDQIDKFK